MHRSFLTNIVLLLSVFFTVGLAAQDKFVVVQRQSAEPVYSPSAPECIEYATTANLSTIGTNSTYRGLYLRASPVGTIANARMFSAAQARLPAMMMDPALNGRCGNLTDLALKQAEANLTQGIVAQFNKLPAPGIKAGPEVLAVVGVVVLVFTGTWSFMS
ncbi:hypothetical protein CC78DRAFT_548020 [Lojkania enalia]|uniref:Uncharacterized protein n=1 Tax=Lojkania enalia TaxID=147567 RepID=A0A9P4N5S0_9PLEO|nr:hypothetical protein CC78DRAFT_548020 [Didymosphaeria enalia]